MFVMQAAELMLQQQRLRSDGTYATWPEESHQGDQQVHGEDEELAHGANRSRTTVVRKTAPHRGIPSYYEFATHRRKIIGVSKDVVGDVRHRLLTWRRLAENAVWAQRWQGQMPG